MEELQLNFPIRMHSYLIISIPEESDMLLFTGLMIARETSLSSGALPPQSRSG